MPSSQDTSSPPPASGFKGKWFVVALAPLLIGISIWLYYLRSTFKHPTSTFPIPTPAKLPR